MSKWTTQGVSVKNRSDESWFVLNGRSTKCQTICSEVFHFISEYLVRRGLPCRLSTRIPLSHHQFSNWSDEAGRVLNGRDAVCQTMCSEVFQLISEYLVRRGLAMSYFDECRCVSPSFMAEREEKTSLLRPSFKNYSKERR